MTRDCRSLLVLLALLLSACASERPVAATCPPTKSAALQSFDAALNESVTAHWESAPGEKHHRVAILVLSGGGGWGAYGAGFLNGWTQRPANADERWPSRPEFDVVTGVSTGALMAPFALVGSSADPSLEKAFRGVSGDDLYSGNGLLGLLWGHSLKKPDRLEHRLLDALDDATLGAIKAASSEKRSAWVGAVNFDTGQFTEFNLSAIARDLPADQARIRITDDIMAASALPGFFPPRFIDGCMYMDGGVRENVFVTPVQATTGVANTGESRADIYVIENGPAEVPSVLTQSGVRDIATRGYELTENQVQINSLRNIYHYAMEHGYGFYWTSADDVVYNPGDEGQRAGTCKAARSPADQFEAAFTSCLYDAALHKARDGATPWRTDRP